MPPADLRSRLIDTGAELLAAEGIQALSLREITRRAGVSHGAPRRYFPTHLDLLSAIARRGFTELAAMAAEVIGDGTGDPRRLLHSLTRAYVDFALSNRGMFELMVRHDLLESNRLGLRDTSLPLFQSLVDLIGRVEQRPTSAPPQVVAGALWANLHGIIQLWGWGGLPLATGLDDVDPLLRAALDAHIGPVPS